MLDRMACGEIARKPHTALRGPGGQLRYEECLTRAGFDGPFTILYHEHRPHVLMPRGSAPGWDEPRPAGTRELVRRHYRSRSIETPGLPPSRARVPLLFSADLTIGIVKPSQDDPAYFSNADGDDLYYVLQGGGRVRSPFGDLEFRSGDYVLVPKGVLHRFVLDPALEQHWLSLEFPSGVAIPERFRNELGQLRMDAPYSHRDFRRPEFRGPLDEGIRDLVVKRRSSFHRFSYEHNPLDVVGWDGAVYPWAFAILDFQPRVASVHLPPTWHGTFKSHSALVCSFVPRPLDFGPDAVPCPYPHSSVDVDEVIFYCKGDFTSRRGIEVGSISHHPAGIGHGPHQDAYERSLGKTHTEELAVMLDCYAPLERTQAALALEDASYHDSF